MGFKGFDRMKNAMDKIQDLQEKDSDKKPEVDTKKKPVKVIKAGDMSPETKALPDEVVKPPKGIGSSENDMEPRKYKKGGVIKDLKKAGFYDAKEDKAKRLDIINKVTTKPERIEMVDKMFSAKKMASGGSTNVLGKGILARQAAIAKAPLSHPHPARDFYLRRAALLKNKTALVRPPPVKPRVGIVPGSTYKGYTPGHLNNRTGKMASGGSVSSASKRADGCATKGKTKGRIV